MRHSLLTGKYAKQNRLSDILNDHLEMDSDGRFFVSKIRTEQNCSVENVSSTAVFGFLQRELIV